MPNKSPGKPKRRSFGDRLAHAFFRWESAVTIALLILAAFFLPSLFPQWQWEYWLALGILGLAETLIVVSGLGARVPQEASPELGVRALGDKKLREQVEKALEYRQRIEALVQRQGEGSLRLATAGVADWANAVADVARRLDGAPPQQAPIGRARLQLENTLAALGVVHVRLQLAQAGDAAGTTQRVQEDVAEQTALLRDLAEALGRA